jgi:hypothetical protein
MIEGATSRLARAGFLAGKYSQDISVSPEVAAERREVPISIQNNREPNNLTKGAGSGIVLWAELECGGIIGGSAVGTKGKPPETVGEEAATQLIKEIDAGGCVDEVEQFYPSFFVDFSSCLFSGLRIRLSYSWHSQKANLKYDVEQMVLVFTQGSKKSWLACGRRS